MAGGSKRYSRNNSNGSAVQLPERGPGKEKIKKIYTKKKTIGMVSYKTGLTTFASDVDTFDKKFCFAASSSIYYQLFPFQVGDFF